MFAVDSRVQATDSSDSRDTNVTDSKANFTQESKEKVRELANNDPGLQKLAGVSGLLVKQKYDVLEVISGFERNNIYDILNQSEVKIYKAKEESGILSRLCFGTRRRFVIRVYGLDDHEVIKISRNFKCCALSLCCTLCDCSAYQVKVEAPVGSVCGFIDTKCSFFDVCNIKFIIKDSDLTPILKIRTRCCLCRTCPTPVRSFKITKISDKKVIGMLRKEWAGFGKEALTDADTFSLTFHEELDVCTKALLLGSLFLLDFMFYEKSKKVVTVSTS